jgi:hypothetical protein
VGVKSQKKILKITSWIIFILLLLLGLAYLINQQIKDKYCNFRKLKYDSIEYIVLIKFNYEIESDSLLLSEKQMRKVICKWNNSYPIGPIKFIPSFILKVKLKKGSIRNFNYIDGCIKENGWGYRFVFNGNFITEMWHK